MSAKKYVCGAMILASACFLSVVVPVFAADNAGANRAMEARRFNGQARQNPGIFGTVAGVSGNTVTVTANQGPNSTTATTTYTVDASNAKVTKDNATSSVSNIAVGDTVVVQGTINGTSVIATAIRDGQMPGRNMGQGKASQNPVITGNGQPVVAGTVSSIGSNSMTITNKSNVVYAIDTTNAKITQGQNAIQLSVVKTGDPVVVQGTVNGTSVVASSIIDQARPAGIQAANTGNTVAPANHPKTNFGFFGAIGQFFKNIFGF